MSILLRILPLGCPLAAYARCAVCGSNLYWDEDPLLGIRQRNVQELVCMGGSHRSTWERRGDVLVLLEEEHRPVRLRVGSTVR